MAVLPADPGVRRGGAHCRIGVCHQAGVGLDQSTFTTAVPNSCLLGMTGESIPGLGIDRADRLGDPLHLESIGRGDSHQYDAGDAVRMYLRIGECQRRSPGDTVDEPAFDP
jgi:hypothetical protein